MNREIKEKWLVQNKKIDVTIKLGKEKYEENASLKIGFKNDYPTRLHLDLLYKMRLQAKFLATEYLWELFSKKNWKKRESKKFTKKYNKLIHSRGAFISRIIVARARRLICEEYNITEDTFFKIVRICSKIWIGRKRYTTIDEYVMFFLRMKNEFSEQEFNILLSDFSKYSISVCKWLLLKLREKTNVSFSDYMNLLKEIPPIVKKCKYGFCIIDKDQEEFLKIFNPNPQNRFQYFWLITLMMCEGWFWNNQDMIPKLLKMDIKSWHYFKEYKHLKNQPYSIYELRHLLTTLTDGRRIYNEYKNNNYNVQFAKVDGSPLRMTKNAIFNHRQEQKIRKQELFSRPNTPMVTPPIKLPDWIEEIRIKDIHSLIKAGIECEHCIGSYTHSPDIFVRENDICCQIDRNTLRVIQCYDTQDRITQESRDLEKRITKALGTLKKEEV